MDDIARLEISPSEMNGNLGKRAVEEVLHQGVAHPALLRAARGLLGQTQDELAGNADIAVGTYRRFERDDFGHKKAIEATTTLAKLLTRLAAEGVHFTYASSTGAGVARKGIGPEELPNLL